jgi:uncharacterized Fe-S cluster protein YjdI
MTRKSYVGENVIVSFDEVIAQVELCPSGALRIEPKESSSS